MSVSSSTISGNSSRRSGGISANTVTVNTSTISANNGGGISAQVDLTIDFSTIVGNFSRNGVGGVSGQNVNISNSIVAANRGTFADLESAESVIVEYSLIGDNRGTDLSEAALGSPDIRGNLIGGPESGIIDPRIAPLKDNGGPTFTHALLPGSPAIDAGNPLATAGGDDVSLHDQRGETFLRVASGHGAAVARIDMGAHERQYLTASFLGISSPTVTPVDDVTIRFTSAVNGFDLSDLKLSLNGGENLLTGDETLNSTDNQTFVLGGTTDATGAAGYYTLSLIVSESQIRTVDERPLDSDVSISWAMGRETLGLTVDTLTDEADGRIKDGDISLRDAINIAAPGETINFDVSLDGGTIRLTLGELLITRPLTIDATELANGLVIDSHENVRSPEGLEYGGGSPTFEIDDGNPFSDSRVAIRGLTLTGSHDDAIRSDETLSIESVWIVGNSFTGIETQGELTVSSSTISDNGGGIFGTNVTVNSSTVSENRATGIYAAYVTVNSSAISANDGGGITANNVKVDSSTISGNTTRGNGGGISSFPRDVKLQHNRE